MTDIFLLYEIVPFSESEFHGAFSSVEKAEKFIEDNRKKFRKEMTKSEGSKDVPLSYTYPDVTNSIAYLELERHEIDKGVFG
jgi:hypothetical protein